MSRANAGPLAVLLSCALLPLAAMGAQQPVQVEPDQPFYYANCQAGFAIIWPDASHQPMVRDTRYTIPYYANNLPAKEYYIDKGGNHYSVTVVDFSNGPRADEELVDTAAGELRKKGEVRYQAFADYDPGMPGRQLNIFEPNNRHLRASLYMAYHKLVITQAETAVDDFDSIQFEQSIVLVDDMGYDIDRVNAMDGTGSEPLRQFPCVR